MPVCSSSDAAINIARVAHLWKLCDLYRGSKGPLSRSNEKSNTDSLAWGLRDFHLGATLAGHIIGRG